MVVTYIGHSGFLMETNSLYFLFDYYQGEIPELKQDKPLIVFVSHKHKDHYNDEIFDILKRHPYVRFVLGKGVSAKFRTMLFMTQGLDLESRIIPAPKNTDLEIISENGKFLKVTTLRSTDEGVAYLLYYENQVYFHAGDLNLWVWDGETKQKNEAMREKFLKELEKLRGVHIDVAFFPLDPRLENHAFEGMELFLEYTDTEKVFPMHMWGQYDIIEAFQKKHPEYAGKIMDIARDGQQFTLLE